MHGLPDDFADTLARVIEPGSREAAAEVIRAATRLDDEQLRDFLSRFARRVRESSDPVTADELRQLLRAARSRAGSRERFKPLVAVAIARAAWANYRSAENWARTYPSMCTLSQAVN